MAYFAWDIVQPSPPLVNSGALNPRPPRTSAAVSQVLLGLRKHGQNLSRQRRAEQRAAADAAAARAMTRLLKKGRGPRDEVTLAHAAAVRRPESAGSVEELAEAARLLGDLGAAAAAAAAEEEEEEIGGPAGIGRKGSPDKVKIDVFEVGLR